MNKTYAILLALIISSGTIFSQDIGQIDPELDFSQFDLDIQLDDEDLVGSTDFGTKLINDRMVLEAGRSAQQAAEQVTLDVDTLAEQSRMNSDNLSNLKKLDAEDIDESEDID